MKPILIADVETTGFDAKKDEIIEIGAALFDWETKKPVSLQSDIIQYDGVITPEITRITGIETWMVKKPYAIPLKTAMFRLSRSMQSAVLLMAHNAQFDMRFLKAAAEKTGITLPELTIVDTMRDLPFPSWMKSKALNYLLTDHNLYNPFKHRAVFDCLSTFQLAACYDLEDIIEAQESELITVEAVVSYEDKELARERGFHWNKDARKWLMEMKKSRYEKMEFPFETKIDFEIPF